MINNIYNSSKFSSFSILCSALTNLLCTNSFYFSFQIFIAFSAFAALIVVTSSDLVKKPTATVTRTELKVSRSLDPEKTQTLNVMTRDGSVAQLIVKRRDAKSKGSTQIHQANIYDPYQTQNLYQSRGDENYQNVENVDDFNQQQYPKAVFSNWIPLSSVYYQPKIIRLDSIAVVRNSTNARPVENHLGNVIDSDR